MVLLYWQSHFKGLTKHNDRTKSGISLGNDKDSSSNLLEINLEKQLQAWKENPTWVDQSPDIKVRKSLTSKMIYATFQRVLTGLVQ